MEREAAARGNACGLRRRDLLRLGQTFCMVFKPFNAENLSGNRLVQRRAPIQ